MILDEETNEHSPKSPAKNYTNASLQLLNKKMPFPFRTYLDCETSLKVLEKIEACDDSKLDRGRDK